MDFIQGVSNGLLLGSELGIRTQQMQAPLFAADAPSLETSAHTAIGTQRRKSRAAAALSHLG